METSKKIYRAYCKVDWNDSKSYERFEKLVKKYFGEIDKLDWCKMVVRLEKKKLREEEK